jgi:hypothetical protein
MYKALALVASAAIATGVLADEPLVAAVVDAPIITTTEAALTAATEAAVVQTAKLDAALVETSSMELFGLSSSVTTGLVFFTVALTTFVVTTDGDAGGVPATH